MSFRSKFWRKNILFFHPKLGSKRCFPSSDSSFSWYASTCTVYTKQDILTTVKPGKWPGHYFPYNLLIQLYCILFQDVRDDVGGAQAIGIKGILVKTGRYIIIFWCFVYCDMILSKYIHVSCSFCTFISCEASYHSNYIKILQSVRSLQ